MLDLRESQLVRGGISRGTLYDRNNMFFGQALNNAYLLEENFAQYPRIIIPKEIIEEYENRDDNDDFDTIIPYIVIAENDGFYVTNYVKTYDKGGTNRDNVFELNEYCKRMLNSVFDKSIREKYIYIQSLLYPYLYKNDNQIF